MLGLLFSIWGLGVGTVALLALAVFAFLSGRIRIAEILVGVAVLHLAAGYLFQQGVRDCQARTERAVAAARDELQRIADAAVRAAQDRGAQDSARAEQLQQQIALYESGLSSTPAACKATPIDAAHFNSLLPGAKR